MYSFTVKKKYGMWNIRTKQQLVRQNTDIGPESYATFIRKLGSTASPNIITPHKAQTKQVKVYMAVDMRLAYANLSFERCSSSVKAGSTRNQIEQAKSTMSKLVIREGSILVLCSVLRFTVVSCYDNKMQTKKIKSITIPVSRYETIFISSSWRLKITVRCTMPAKSIPAVLLVTA